MLNSFRREAMDGPEDLNELTRLTRPAAWLALGGLSLLLLAALAWSIWGRMPVLIRGEGILLRQGGLKTVRATAEGRITRVLVAGRGFDPDGHEHDGQKVEVDQQVVQQQVGAHEVMATTPYAGQVVDVLVSEGDLVNEGDPLMRVESINPTVRAEALIPLAVAKQVWPGMVVEVSPSYLQRELYGFIWGRVENVAKYPSDAAGIKRLVGGDEDLAAYLMGDAPVVPRVRVTISLLPGPDGQGYLWSSGRAPKQAVNGGTLCGVRIVLKSESPIRLLFPSQ